MLPPPTPLPAALDPDLPATTVAGIAAARGRPGRRPPAASMPPTGPPSQAVKPSNRWGPPQSM